MIYRIPEPVERLANEFSRLPGIGPKSALRIALYIVKSEKNDASELASSIVKAKELIRHCSICGNLTEKDICTICSSSDRDRSVICVVENPQDVIAVESSGEFNGLYHVLMGSLSPLDGIGPGDLTIEKLIKRVKEDDVKEVILATDPNVEGEVTATYIKDLLKGISLKVTCLARGIPIGGNLEYADGVTLGRAIEGRREF
jgi:recombination protein RecR